MRIVTPTQFKQLNRSCSGVRTGSTVGLRKQMVGEIERADDRRLRFTISTASVDREQDTIALSGWDVRQYLRNPVVLWGHDAAALPIGRALDVGIEGGALKATVEFIAADMPERGQFAEAVYRLAHQGVIRATSVGFRPLKWAYTEDKARGADDWFPGIDFQEQELLELSIVTVPANPEALLDQPLPAPAAPAEIASDTPPATGEEVTSFNQEQARTRARRTRVLQLAQASLQMHRYAPGAR
jgi:HK97 family phage prohead protease